MKVPKELRTYCPRCRTHSVHIVSIYKRGREKATREGARRHAEEKKGYGGQKFPELVRTAKTTKKQTMKLRCKECGYILMREGIRLRKMEIMA